MPPRRGREVQGAQATQVRVAWSQLLATPQLVCSQLSPGLAVATHVLSCVQTPIQQYPASGSAEPGIARHAAPGLPAGTQMLLLASHVVHVWQAVATSPHGAPAPRRPPQTPCRQNSVARHSLSARHAPRVTGSLQVPMLCGSAGSAVQNAGTAHGTVSAPVQVAPTLLPFTQTLLPEQTKS
jgi:hypothetical protein